MAADARSLNGIADDTDVLAFLSDTLNALIPTDFGAH